MSSIFKDIEQLEISYIAGGSVKLYDYGKYSSSFLHS